MHHHKFIIADSRVIVTGSFNWSKNAEDNNYENYIIVKSIKLAQCFAQEFEWVWDYMKKGQVKPKETQERESRLE